MDSAFSLVSFHRQYFEPLFLCDARPATFKAYAETLRHWKRITGDPPMPFGPIVLATFKIELQKIVAAATVNKHLRHVNALLAKAGPAGSGNRDTLGLISSTPWTRPLQEDKQEPRLVSDDLISRIYFACKFARRPRFKWCLARLWWQALICMAITTGFRRGAMMALRWSDIDINARTVRVPASIDKCHRTRIKPLNSVAISHILSIRGPHHFVFPFTACEREWYRDWHVIQDFADIPTGEHIKLHDLKRFAGTRYAATASPWVVQQMLDHSSIETSRFYINSTEQCRAAVDAFPLPACFKEVL